MKYRTVIELEDTTRGLRLGKVLKFDSIKANNKKAGN